MMTRALRLAAAVFLLAPKAFGASIVELSVLPPSAVVVAPQAGSFAPATLPPDAASALAAHPDIATNLAAQGQLVVLSENGQTLLIPQTLGPRAHAAVIASASDARPVLIAVTRQMADGLKRQMEQNDFTGAMRALDAHFDLSQAQPAASVAPAAPVDASQTEQAVQPSGLANARGGRTTARAPHGPPAPKSGGKADERKPTWEKSQPLPPHIDLESEFESADQAVDMFATHDYPGKKGVDPADLLLEDVQRYIADKRMPNDKKHFIFKYFEIGDKFTGGHSKAVQAVESLVKAGIKTTIVTDINQSMTGMFAEGKAQSSDFENGTINAQSGPGRALKYFTDKPAEGGLGFTFKYGEGKFSIVSGVPLFKKSPTEKPLAHDKGYVAEGPDGMAYEFAGQGTANMNATEDSDQGSHGGRYNAVTRSKDRVSNTVDLKQALAEIEAFNKRKGFSKDIPKEMDAPKRVHYGKKGADGKFVRSGEWREHANTNGRQNPNDRTIAQLELATKALLDAKAGKTRPKVTLKKIIFSHFVLTYSPEVEALRKYMDALVSYRKEVDANYNKGFKVFAVFDQQFISPDGFGEAAALDGTLVQRPMGKSIFPFRSEFMEMMDLHAYVRLLNGVDKINPNTAPTKVHLWHDKTTIMEMEELNEQTGQAEEWTYAWTRSLNNSGHFQSLESQDMYRLKPTSRLAQDFKDRIEKVAAAESQYVIKLDKAIAMSVLAHFTGHTIYDEGMLGYAEQLIDALTHMNVPTVKSIVERVMGIPTKNVNEPDAASVAERIGRFTGFLEWYANERRADKSLNFMTYRKALNIMVGVATDNDWNMRTALDVLYWRFDNKEQLEALMRKAWTDGLRMTRPFPEPKAHDAPTA